MSIATRAHKAHKLVVTCQPATSAIGDHRGAHKLMTTYTELYTHRIDHDDSIDRNLFNN